MPNSFKLGFILLLNYLPLCFAADHVHLEKANLEYEIKGNGKTTVLFDAGALSGMAGWDSIWEGLPPDIRAIRYSRRGEGNSSPCKGQLTIEDYVQDLHDLLTQLKVNRPVVYVSHSFGGTISKAYASQYPGKVKAMLLVDPANPRDIEIVKAIDPVRGEQETLQTKQADYEMGKGKFCFLDIIWDKTPSPGLAQIGDTPITLIAGTKKVENPKRIFDTDKAKALWGQYQSQWVNQFPQGRAVVTNQSGHFVQDDEPDLVLRELKFLLKRLPSNQKSVIHQ